MKNFIEAVDLDAHVKKLEEQLIDVRAHRDALKLGFESQKRLIKSLATDIDELLEKLEKRGDKVGGEK